MDICYLRKQRQSDASLHYPCPPFPPAPTPMQLIVRTRFVWPLLQDQLKWDRQELEHEKALLQTEQQDLDKAWVEWCKKDEQLARYRSRRECLPCARCTRAAGTRMTRATAKGRWAPKDVSVASNSQIRRIQDQRPDHSTTAFSFFFFFFWVAGR